MSTISFKCGACGRSRGGGLKFPYLSTFPRSMDRKKRRGATKMHWHQQQCSMPLWSFSSMHLETIPRTPLEDLAREWQPIVLATITVSRGVHQTRRLIVGTTYQIWLRWRSRLSAQDGCQDDTNLLQLQIWRHKILSRRPDGLAAKICTPDDWWKT